MCLGVLLVFPLEVVEDGSFYAFWFVEEPVISKGALQNAFSYDKQKAFFFSPGFYLYEKSLK